MGNGLERVEMQMSRNYRGTESIGILLMRMEPSTGWPDCTEARLGKEAVEVGVE